MDEESEQYWRDVRRKEEYEKNVIEQGERRQHENLKWKSLQFCQKDGMERNRLQKEWWELKKK